MHSLAALGTKSAKSKLCPCWASWEASRIDSFLARGGLTPRPGPAHSSLCFHPHRPFFPAPLHFPPFSYKHICCWIPSPPLPGRSQPEPSLSHIRQDSSPRSSRSHVWGDTSFEGPPLHLLHQLCALCPQHRGRGVRGAAQRTLKTVFKCRLATPDGHSGWRGSGVGVIVSSSRAFGKPVPVCEGRRCTWSQTSSVSRGMTKRRPCPQSRKGVRERPQLLVGEMCSRKVKECKPISQLGATHSIWARRPAYAQVLCV